MYSHVHLVKADTTILGYKLAAGSDVVSAVLHLTLAQDLGS